MFAKSKGAEGWLLLSSRDRNDFKPTFIHNFNIASVCSTHARISIHISIHNRISGIGIRFKYFDILVSNA